MEQPSDEMYQDILEKVFHAPAGGGLHLCAIRGAAGELGLKASGAQSYFGLIYIGDISAFKNLVESDDAGLTLEEDALAGSLFDGINGPQTKNRGSHWREEVHGGLELLACLEYGPA